VAAKNRRKGRTDYEDWPWAAIVGKPKEPTFQVIAYISGSQPFSYCGTLLTPKIVTEHFRHRKTSRGTLKAKKLK
jgi:hypothetical protein